MFGLVVTEKLVKKWEYGLEYPNTDAIYKLSELYMIPSQDFITAKNNSYEQGLNSIHATFIKWFCYITGASLAVGWAGLYVIIFLALVYAFSFFLAQVENFHNYKW